MPDLDAAVDHIEDDVLRLMFISCHPVLTTESRVALTLRLVGGLTTGRSPGPTCPPRRRSAQRISRAKRTIAEAGVPFEVPSGPERPERLASVLEVVYLIFNEGYAATDGRRLGAAGAVRRGAAAGRAAGRHWRRASPRCTGCSR